MITTGLVSVTFRNLDIASIVDLVSEAGLNSIEWGGDIHVPHGDISAARHANQCTADAGLTIAAYGSYYRLEPRDTLEFARVLDTAAELGAPLIRVWAGTKPSSQVDDEYRGRILEDALRIADMAASAGIKIAFEYHGNTLTDTSESALWLMNSVAHPNVQCMWQPPVALAHEECLKGLHEILPWLANVHVFHWLSNPPVRHSLAEGESLWRDYLSVVANEPGPHCALLEFVKDDDPQVFLEDARVLKGLLGQLVP